MASLAGNIEHIRINPSHADTTFSIIQDKALALVEKNEEIKEILKNAQLGARDVTAAERMLANLLNQVNWIKIGLFKQNKIINPDIR